MASAFRSVAALARSVIVAVSVPDAGAVHVTRYTLLEIFVNAETVPLSAEKSSAASPVTSLLNVAVRVEAAPLETEAGTAASVTVAGGVGYVRLSVVSGLPCAAASSANVIVAVPVPALGAVHVIS